MNAPAYRIDGRPTSAQAFYAAACDPRRHAVVEACAGAGKTWMLVSRVLRALLAGALPQQILAITFTRKAAGEMRARLDEWLAAWSAPAADDATRVAELVARGLDEAEARALAPRLAGLHEQLLAAGREVEVRTFHGWFAQLLAHAPLALLDELALPAGAELVEDTAALGPALFARFHRAVLADEALSADYRSLVREHRRAVVQSWLEEAWRRSTEVEAAASAGTLDDSVPPAAALWPECAGLDDPRALVLLAPLRSAFDALARALGAATQKTRQTAAAGLCDALVAADAGDAASAFDLAWSALFTKDGAPRKLGDPPGFADACERLQAIARMVAQQQAHADHARMARLARALLAEFAALKRERGLVDMPDLERAALAMLSDSALSGWVQERLDQRVRQLLIDEFQDTSPLQWQALSGWLSAYAGAGNAPSIFIVGDPKQSIYRFRRAEPRVFAAAREFVQRLGGAVLECDHTRRNAPAVVEVFNAVFEDARANDGWEPFRAHTTGSDRPGAVRRLPRVERPGRGRGKDAEDAEPVWRDSLAEPRHEAEDELRAHESGQVAAAIAELLHAGWRGDEIMVLARRRAALRHVARALARAHIAHAMPEPMALAEIPEALDLAALLDAIASPGHDLSLARALKSPIFGAGDDDLIALARRAGTAPSTDAPRTNWRAALAMLAADGSAGAALARAARLLEGWQDAASRLPPHDLIDRVLHEGELAERYAAAVPPERRALALQALQAVLAAALEHEGGRWATLYGFVRALKSGALRSAAAVPAGAVQLLTVHGAKGLEARAVFVVDSDPEAQRAGSATLLVDWEVGRRAPARVAFVRSESRLPPSLDGLWAAEQQARAREELNGLYVALTRAQEQLVLSSTPPWTGADRSWWQRLEARAAPWTPQPVAALESAAAAIAVPALPPLAREVAPLPASAQADNPAAARLGSAIHRALEWSGQPGRRTDPARAARAAAAAFGVDAERVAAVAARVLSHPAGALFFGGPALCWAGNEVPLADDQGAMRLDRLVLLDEGAEGTAACWWVIDYKLGLRPAEVPAYREQMARYIAAVAAAQPGDAVRGGFIAGDGDFVEFVTD